LLYEQMPAKEKAMTRPASRTENSPACLVAVVGGSRATAEETAAADAVGRALAEAGAVLVCGGRGGVMEAACRGARSAGGLTVGVLPGASRREANPFVDVPIVTGMGEARNAIITRTARAVIAVGGSYGTLSEIALALASGAPVVGLETWRVERDGHPPAPIVYAKTPEEAVARALEMAEGD
jgi:hypothetical protein